MPLPTDQEGRGRGGIPWMQPANCDIDFSDFVTNTYTTQAAGGLSMIPRVASANRGSLAPSRVAFRGPNGMDVPRGDVATEPLRALGIRVVDRNIESQHLLRNVFHAEEGHESAAEKATHPNIERQHLLDDMSHAEDIQEEAEYVTHSEVSRPAKRARKITGPSSEEWEAKKAEIYNLYMENNYFCWEVVAEMAQRDFIATEPMYKRRFDKWGWKTYERTNSSGRLGGQAFIRRAGRRSQRRTPASSPSTLRNESSNASNSRGSTVAVFSPPHLNPTRFNPARFNLRIPMTMGKSQIDGLVDTMLFNVETLCISHIVQGKWKVANQYEVEEDDHDDLLVGVATSLRNYDSLTPEIGSMGIQKAFQTLEKVVGTKKGADCGLFSLPAIWESFLRMIRNGRADLAGSFLERALQLAKQRFGPPHPFVQALVSLQKIQMREPDKLKEVVFTAYRSCIDHVKKTLGVSHLTFISLWADFVVYLDCSSTNEIREMVNNLRSVIRQSEDDNGWAHDYTLKLLGLSLYVLQSTPSMAAEAEEVASDMLNRVNQRIEAGEELEGDLLIIWKDLRHTLGNFCHVRGDDNMAVIHLEACIMHGDVDDRNTFALDNLEEWYTLLCKFDEAKRVRQRRIESSQILLGQNDTELAERERAGDREDVDEEGSEATAVDMVEESQEETVEDDNTVEVRDAEAEIKRVQAQIGELKQKLNVLQKKVEKQKGKNTTS